MLALAVIDADVCPGCKGRLSETTAQDSYGRPAHRYVTEPPHRCYRCTSLAVAQRAAKDAPQPQALLWSVTESTSEGG